MSTTTTSFSFTVFFFFFSLTISPQAGGLTGSNVEEIAARQKSRDPESIMAAVTGEPAAARPSGGVARHEKHFRQTRFGGARCDLGERWEVVVSDE